MTTSEPAAVGVLIVDDDPLVRAGLAMMLGGAPDIRVVAEAGDGGEVLPMVDRHAPDVVLMDIRMPAMDGLAATEALRARRHAPEVIILTTFDADEHVLRALRAGGLRPQGHPTRGDRGGGPAGRQRRAGAVLDGDPAGHRPRHRRRPRPPAPPGT